MQNWLSQIISVSIVSFYTIPRRLGASITTTIGIAGVVAVFVGVLSIAEGFRAAMRVSSPQDSAIVLRKSADSEMTSGLSLEETKLIADAPGVARTASGGLASSEMFVIINLPKRSTKTDANVPFRGVEKAAMIVRDDFKIVQGRNFESGKNEVIAGVGAARAFEGLDVGEKIRLGANEWAVVGIFSGGGGSSESEMWADAPVLQAAYHYDAYQSVRVKLASPGAYPQFTNSLLTDPRLKVKVQLQSEFLADQSSMLTSFIESIGVFIAAMMALGALFGALNTMYNAVSARTREIATLRALGFGATPVVISVLLESLVLALVGGVLGATAAYLFCDGLQAATINWQTFSQIAFAFAVTPKLLVSALVLAVSVGFIGGLFPAIRAARLPIASGLREL